MRTFDQLTEGEQAEAVNIELGQLLTAILEGAIRFNDAANGDTMQAAIDAACRKADDMRTPWFAHEYVLDASFLEATGGKRRTRRAMRDALESMARASAEDAMFPDADEHVIRLSGKAAA